jgi:hypothetical protein
MIHALCASVNQLRQEAACLRHLPLLADNFQPVALKSRGNSDKLILSLCEGKDLKQDKIWLNAIFLTSQRAIINSKSCNAAFYRTLQVKVNDNLFKDRFVAEDLINENYGLAGPIFIEALKSMELQDRLRNTFNDCKIRIEAEFGEKSNLTKIAAILMAVDQITEEIIFKSGHNLTISDLSACIGAKIQ